MDKASLKHKYTVILTNYNSGNYIFSALDSIFFQDYPNIELIVTDDASNDFNLKDIIRYIKNHKKKNIKSVQFIINKKNIGTVKTLNKALKKSTGEFILFFASDDRLSKNNVLTRFFEAFQNEQKNIISSQWVLCDDKLNVQHNYLNVLEARVLNLISAKLQFLRLCKSNIYGAGATTYRASIFKKYGYLDEKYYLLEDWPLWLKMLWNNDKIYYENFVALYHRGGGLSQTSNLTKSKKIFFNELILVYRREILSKLDSFSNIIKIYLLKCYKRQIDYLSRYSNLQNEYNYLNFLINLKHLRFFWRLDHLNPHLFSKIIILWNYNKQVVFSFLFTIIFCVLYNLKKPYLDNNSVLFVSLASYVFIYILMNWIIKLKNIIKERRKRI